MRYKTTYRHKKTGASYTFDELGAIFAVECKDGRTFDKFIDDEFNMICKPVQTPYERTRAAVYATGNKWAIENFNATHN